MRAGWAREVPYVPKRVPPPDPWTTRRVVVSSSVHTPQRLSLAASAHSLLATRLSKKRRSHYSPGETLSRGARCLVSHRFTYPV